LLQPNWSWCRF